MEENMMDVVEQAVTEAVTETVANTATTELSNAIPAAVKHGHTKEIVIGIGSGVIGTAIGYCWHRWAEPKISSAYAEHKQKRAQKKAEKAAKKEAAKAKAEANTPAPAPENGINPLEIKDTDVPKV